LSSARFTPTNLSLFGGNTQPQRAPDGKISNLAFLVPMSTHTPLWESIATEEGVDQMAEMSKHSRITGSAYLIFTKITLAKG
jgi:hypothetical protein